MAQIDQIKSKKPLQVKLAKVFYLMKIRPAGRRRVCGLGRGSDHRGGCCSIGGGGGINRRRSCDRRSSFGGCSLLRGHGSDLRCGGSVRGIRGISIAGGQHNGKRADQHRQNYLYISFQSKLHSAASRHKLSLYIVPPQSANVNTQNKTPTLAGGGKLYS